MSNHCDKCKGKIIQGKCPCGFWSDNANMPDFIKTLEKAIYAYDFMCEQFKDDSPFTGDHHSGNCIVLFKGTYEDVMQVRKFILDLKNVR